MKIKVLILVLVFCLCLAGCSKRNTSTSNSRESKSSSQYLEANEEGSEPGDTSSKTEEDQALYIEDSEIIMLTESAEVLTMALTASTSGLSTDSKAESEMLTYPSIEKPNSINQFLYLLASYQSRGYEYSFYANDIYNDSEGIFHLSEEGILNILKDVFNIFEWDSSTSAFEYNSDTKEYTTGLEFGIGFNWECGEILNSQIDVNQRIITVEYRAENLFVGAAGDDVDEITSWMCKNTFSINKKENGQMYLTFVKTEIL